MTALRTRSLVLAAAVGWAGAAAADVHWNGLYHNSTNLVADTEAVPVLGGPAFRNVSYTGTNVTFYFLTDSPAGNAGESVVSKVRLWSNREYFENAAWVTNAVLQAGVNPFHGTPSVGAVTVDVWKATWLPTRQFNGTVYYAPQILTYSNGAQTDYQCLLRALIPNNTGPDGGTNDSFWANNPQLIGTNFFDDDYSFQWTNSIPFNFDWVYFNHTGAGHPTNEAVPGLGGTKFFEYSYVSNQPSYAYTISADPGITSMLFRMYVAGGGGDTFRSGSLYTTVVLTASSPFHGLPTGDDVTVAVWRAAFYPPARWQSDLWFGPQIGKPGDGTMWLVNNFNGITFGATATNNFPTNPQYLYSEGAATHDWLFQPTGAIARTGLNLEWAYYTSTNLSPLTEKVPGYDGSTFLKVDYATTTTTFHVLTDVQRNLVPGETNDFRMRIAWFNPDPNIFNWSNETPFMTWVTNLTLSSAAPFHGLPAAGTHTVALWRLIWHQPTTTNGTAFTNLITVFYAPWLRSIVGADGYETDYRYLVRRVDGLTNYWGYNSYAPNPQYYGLDPTGDHDFRYANNRVGLDGFYFNNTNTALPQDEAVPGLPGRKFFEYNYGTDDVSHVHVLAPLSGFSSLSMRMWFNNGGGEMFYNASWVSNVVIDSGSPFHGLPLSGAITLGVWRATFRPPPNWTGPENLWLAPRVTLNNGTTLYMVHNISGDLAQQAEVNGWATNAQFFYADNGGRDWFFQPTGAVARTRSVNTDWAYYCNTNSYNPQTELVPGTGGRRFMEVNYATTTTTFHILTEKPLNLYAEESAWMSLRVAWTTNWFDWSNEYPVVVWVTNLVLDAGSPFHGLPVSGQHTVDLWRAVWGQARDASGVLITNDVQVFYQPLLKTTLGSQNYQTDQRWLVTRTEALAGWGLNNYATDPQGYGPLEDSGYDYFYLNHWTVGTGFTDGIPDSWWDRYLIAGPQRRATNDLDIDAADNLEEYIADTNPTNGASVFSNRIVNASGGSTITLQVGPPTTNSRLYDVWWKTNLLESGDWQPFSYDLPGDAGGAALQIQVPSTPHSRFYRTGVRIP
jgi:hypothetical protein